MGLFEGRGVIPPDLDRPKQMRMAPAALEMRARAAGPEGPQRDRMMYPVLTAQAETVEEIRRLPFGPNL